MPATVAFAISTAEADVLKSIPALLHSRVDGVILRFKAHDMPALMAGVSAYAAAHAWDSDEFRAALRLQERLATWIGKQMVDPRQMDMFDSTERLVDVAVDDDLPAPSMSFWRRRAAT